MLWSERIFVHTDEEYRLALAENDEVIVRMERQIEEMRQQLMISK